MKSKKLILSLFGAALAGLWTAQSPAALLVQLEKVSLDPYVLQGGGRTGFEIKAIKDPANPFSSPAPLSFGIVGDVIYASCIEPNEYIDGIGDTKWYKIADLDGAPTSNGGITTGEATRIEKILSNQFNADLTSKGGTTAITADIAALQALLWEAATGDLLNGVDGYGDAADKQLANNWINNASNWTDQVTTYALLAGNWTAETGWTNAERQDFVTFVRDLTPPGSDTPVPVPAPLLLFGTGLLGLYGTLRRRRA